MNFWQDNGCLRKTHSLAGNLGLFWGHLPDTFAADRLPGWNTNGFETGDGGFLGSGLSGKASGPALLPFSIVSLKCQSH